MDIDEFEQTLRDVENLQNEINVKLTYLIESLKDLRRSYYSYPKE